MSPLEKLLQEFSANLPAGMDAQQKRSCVLAAFGYMDAKFMVLLYSTHGYPLEEAAYRAGQYGLKLDVEGLRYELLMIGMQPATVDIHIQRCQEAQAEGLKFPVARVEEA